MTTTRMRRLRREPGEPANHELSPAQRENRLDCDRVFGMAAANRCIYEPGDKGIVAPEGSWAMVTRALPALERDLGREFKPGRVFYLEHVGGADARGFSPNGTYKAICHSVWGDVCLWPYEYSIINVAIVIDLWTRGELLFHPSRLDSARVNEITFYARSRGVPLAAAAVMALGTLHGPIGWFEVRADLAEQAEALAASVNRHFGRMPKR